ncbi:hypothetical protein RUND412_000399 [Rhizina undulata]
MPPRNLLPLATPLRLFTPRLQPSALRTYSTNNDAPIQSNQQPAGETPEWSSSDAFDVLMGGNPAEEQVKVNHKYPLPELPLPSTSHLKHRYNPILEQVTNLLMRDGKKSVAQKNMNKILSILRTKSAPKPNPRIPLIPTAPPLSTLPKDPIAYLQTAIDSLAPLMRVKAVKGSGGFKDNLPMPLGLRQRRRKAVEWILDAADKKKGRMGLAERVADEIAGVIEGRSTAWEKRNQVHKVAVAARANVRVPATR